MAQALLKPHVQQFLDFTTQSMEEQVNIEQVRVSARSSFADATLARMQLPSEMGVIVLAIRKSNGKMLFNPCAESRIGVGDHLIVMGQPDGLKKIEYLLNESSK